jgi:hypothetical protein
MELEWIRRDKLAPSTANERPTTGVDGDPTKATPELGKMFIGWKIDDAVNQIHELLEQNKSFRRRREVVPVRGGPIRALCKSNLEATR